MLREVLQDPPYTKDYGGIPGGLRSDWTDQGCELRVTDREAYLPELDEIQLISYKRMGEHGCTTEGPVRTGCGGTRRRQGRKCLP